jgi:hypothetical protein
MAAAVVVTNQGRTVRHMVLVVVTSLDKAIMHMVEGMVMNEGRVAMQHVKRVIVDMVMVTRRVATCSSRWKRKIQMMKVMSMSRMSLMRTCLFLQARCMTFHRS